METMTKKDFLAYLKRTGEQAPFMTPDGESAYDAEEDGDIIFYTDQNGEIVAECEKSKRFRKYPAE